MENKKLTEAEQKDLNSRSNTALIVGIGTVAGIVFSPTILFTVIVTVVGGGILLLTKVKIEKITGDEKKK